MKKIVLFITLFVLLAAAVSATPTLNPVGSKSVVEGSTISFDLTNTAPDNGTTTYSKDLSYGLLTKVSDTQVTFEWTPGYSESGTYTFTFTAADNDSSDTEVVTISVTDATATLTLSDLQIGSSTQKRKVDVTGTTTVRNTGNIAIDNIVLSALSVDPKYNVRFSPATITSLAAGASQSVTVTVDIPNDHDAITADFNESAMNVGQLQATGTSNVGVVSQNAELTVQARNKLEIDRVIITVDDKDEKLSSNGKTLDDLKPFQEIDFEIFAENKFSDNEDIEFDDVEFRILIDDEGLSIDDTDTTSIVADETESVTFDGDEIDNEADGKMKLEIFVSGVDERGARHGEKWTLTLDVERKSNEIEILSARLLPSTLTCENRDLKVNIKIRNLGTRDQNDVTVQVEIPKLGIDEERTDLDLDSGDDTTEDFFITLDDDAEGKNLDVYVKTYYRGDRSSHSEVLKLTVESCVEEPENTSDSSSDDTTSGTNTVTTTTANTASTTGTTTASTTSVPRTRVSGATNGTPVSEDNDLAITLLVSGIVIVLALIVLLTVFLVKGKK